MFAAKQEMDVTRSDDQIKGVGRSVGVGEGVRGVGGGVRRRENNGSVRFYPWDIERAHNVS